jgi:arylsulfatase A-like enzyme
MGPNTGATSTGATSTGATSTGSASAGATSAGSASAGATSTESARDGQHAPSSAERERSHAGATGPRTLEAVTRWLGREVDERPLFLFVHLWDVHYDYDPPREYVEMFDPGYAGTLDASDLMRNPAVNDHMAPRELDHLIALYDGEIRFTDEILGKILSAIEKRGRMRNTLLVITADHGEEFFEHGGKGHQRSLFDEVVRVPLIARWPGRFTAGSVVRDQVRLVDLMPTLLACGGVEKRPDVQGRDITPLLRGEPMPPASALCELYVDKNDMRALRTNAFKVIEWAHARTVLGYDLAFDAHEQRPLAPELPQVATAHAELESALDSASAFKKRIGASASPLDLPHDVEHSLKALGYAGDPTLAPPPTKR